MIKSYKDLDVWKKSIELVKKIYLLTKGFPKNEIYGLVNQMRRSAVSLPSNIAEGKARRYVNEYVQFLYVALGSCAELETQLIIAKDIGYANERTCGEILTDIDHVGKMLRGLVKSLQEPRT